MNHCTRTIWTKDFILLCSVNLLISVSFYLLLPTLPIYIADILAGDAGSIGYIFGVFALAAMLSRPLAGYLSDTYGRKTILFLALLALALAMASYHLTASLTLLFVVRALHGLVWGFVTTGAGALAADIVPEARRGEGLGYFSLSMTLAMAVGPGIGLAILQHASFSILFTSGFIFAAIALACLPGISAPAPLPNRQKHCFSLDELFEIKVMPHSLITFCIAWLYSGIISFIILFGKQIGLVNAGSYFLAYAGALVISRPYAGIFYDREGPLKIMAIGFATLTLAFLMLYFSKGYLLFLASAVSLGAGFGIVQSATMTMAIEKVAPFRRGVATGTVMTAFELGIGLGSIGLGIISEQFGFAYMYLACALFSIIPAVMFFACGPKTYCAEAKG